MKQKKEHETKKKRNDKETKPDKIQDYFSRRMFIGHVNK